MRTGLKSLLNVKFTPCVSCTVHILCNNDVDRDSDSFRYVIQSCYDLLMFFYRPLAPKWTHLTTLLLVYFLDTPKSPKTLRIISKWEHVMYHHQGYNESIKAENTLIIKKLFISNRNLKKFNKKFKIYKKIGSIYVCRAKSNT